MSQPNSPTDILRARCLDLCEELVGRAQSLRDYALTPGDVWLAKNELQLAAQTLSELEQLLTELKRSDNQEA